MYSNTVLFERQYGEDFDPSRSSILTTMKKHNIGEKQKYTTPCEGFQHLIEKS
jgi:hypothetical protein